MDNKIIDFRAHEYELDELDWLGSNLVKARQSENASLIIGLGGTGRKAIDAVRTEVFVNIERRDQASSTEEAFPHIRFLYVDNDIEGLLEQSDKRLTKCIALNVSYKHPFYDKAFLDDNWANELSTAVLGFCQENLEHHIYVHLISGLAGTVGSNCFLHAAYKVREVLQRNMRSDADIYGYFFIPSPGFGYNYKTLAANPAQNTVQSMLKLDYCMHLPENGGYWEEPDYKTSARTNRFTTPPLDHYFLIPDEPFGAERETASVAMLIAQYIKEETADIFSLDSFLDNASMGSYMTVCYGTRASDLMKTIRTSCARNLYQLIDSLTSKELLSVETYWHRAGMSDIEILRRLEEFCKVDQVLAKQYGEGPAHSDINHLSAIQREFDEHTNSIITELRNKAEAFIRRELTEIFEGRIWSFFENDEESVFSFDGFVSNSCDFFMHKINSAALNGNNSQKSAVMDLAAAQEAFTHSFILGRRDKYLRYLTALTEWKKAQIQEVELEILRKLWIEVTTKLIQFNKERVEPVTKAFMRCKTEQSAIAGITLLDVHSGFSKEQETLNHYNSNKVIDTYRGVIHSLEMKCLKEKYFSVNAGKMLARFMVDEAGRAVLQELCAKNAELVEEYLHLEEPREITWRKDSDQYASGSVLYVSLPEEGNFDNGNIRRLKRRAGVVPVITHRPGVAEYCGCRIHTSLFDADRELDYFHMLGIGSQDAAVYLRNDILGRLFRSESVSEPEKAYVSQIRNITVPKGTTDLEEVLSTFNRIISLSVPAAQLIEKPELLRSFKELELLKLTGEIGEGFENLYLPESLEELDLSGTSLYDMPEVVIKSKILKRLNLSGTHLRTLNPQILDLSERIPFTVESDRNGICIRGIVIDDMDSTILLGPTDSVREWYATRRLPKKEVVVKGLNEVKVIFLGDGEVGKTRTIQRILADGEQTDYNEGPTPGIVIADKIWEIGDRKVKVHFWDFGGQEILYSMHRMFMTQQTVYVILLNARESTQEERANYWLYNVAHFAGKDVPVILIINKIDTNSSAYINRKALEDVYPNIRDITRLSNVTFEREAFMDAVIEPIKSVVGGMQALTEEFPASWQTLAEQLAESDKPYLRERDIRRMMRESTIDRKILFSLLKWFSQIGISFFYGEKPDLSDYIVLKPAWVTNAIYIILANGGQLAKENGILNREDIVNLLLDNHESPEGADGDKDGILRVNSDIHYHETGEVAFVLGLIRYFHLSFEIEEGKEFLPVFCTRKTSNAADEIAGDENALQFKYVYKYLPRLILHRLMVELHVYLELNSVARDQAVFSLRERGLSAAVLKNGEELHIYVRGNMDSDSPDIFLDTIREALRQINIAFDFNPGEYIVYREGGLSEDFDYTRLLSQQRNSKRDTVYSVVFERDIYLSEILNPVNRQMIVWSEFKRELISACLNLQNHGQSIFGDEVKCNVYICDQLSMSERERRAATEHLGGTSGSGRSDRYGERDIVIFDEYNREQFIIECLNVSYAPRQESVKKYLNTGYIKTHLTKLLNQYNPNGLNCLCLVNYVQAEMTDFTQAWNDYMGFIRELNPGSYQFRRLTEDSGERYNFIRAADGIYSVGGAIARVYHVFVRICKE